MITKEAAVVRKARGAFYTPDAIARYLVEWAIGPGTRRVLEPSAGDGVFLEAAARRLREVNPTGELVGVELVEAEAEVAGRRAREAGVDPTLVVTDFFDLHVDRLDTFDAIVGNPPWIRYHGFVGKQRANAQRRALAMGVTLTGLASSWAPYLVHAVSFLSPDGRLAMVLPGELLQVDYAAEVRRFLTRRFRSIRLVAFDGHVFGDAQVDAVLLFASNDGPAGLHFDRVGSLDEIAERIPTVVAGSDRWASSVGSAEATELLVHLEAAGRLVRLGSLGTVDIGVVTGFNDYFVVSEPEAEAFALPAAKLEWIVTRSNQLSDGVVTEAHFNDWRIAGRKVWLLSLGREGTHEATRYLAEGARMGVPSRYKCRMRSPWYAVPIKGPPDLFLSYMAHETPRLAWNQARALSTNLIHGVYLADPSMAPAIASGWANPATALSAEVEGRTYGGGILKLETKEAERVLLPAPGLSIDLTEGEDALLTDAIRVRRLARLRRPRDFMANPTKTA
jgi:tRNA1(Val) A37 N6-methylase TrmN6